jgi:hypothetical protein
MWLQAVTEKGWFMSSAVHAHRLGRQELQAIACGQADTPIDDMEFFETLAAKHCMVMPPWIFHIGPGGRLEKLTPVRYTSDYALDKPSILLAVMHKLQRGPTMAHA